MRLLTKHEIQSQPGLHNYVSKHVQTFQAVTYSKPMTLCLKFDKLQVTLLWVWMQDNSILPLWEIWNQRFLMALENWLDKDPLTLVLWNSGRAGQCVPNGSYRCLKERTPGQNQGNPAKSDNRALVDF